MLIFFFILMKAGKLTTCAREMKNAAIGLRSCLAASEMAGFADDEKTKFIGAKSQRKRLRGSNRYALPCAIWRPCDKFETSLGRREPRKLAIYLR
jgi:hypothetical protein